MVSAQVIGDTAARHTTEVGGGGGALLAILPPPPYLGKAFALA